MKYWKIILNGHGPLGYAEMRTCEIADTLDQAIAAARKGAGATFQSGSASGQVLSDLEMADPLKAERIFVDSGNFNAYLREMA